METKPSLLLKIKQTHIYTTHKKHNHKCINLRHIEDSKQTKKKRTLSHKKTAYFHTT